jgi:hypothetical protein
MFSHENEYRRNGHQRMNSGQGEESPGQRQDGVGDVFIRWAAAGSVVVVTVIAAVISYGHARDLVLRYGVTGLTADFLPLTVDGLAATCSLILVDCARHQRDAPWHAWALLIAGACATVAANVAAGLSHGIIGAIIAGWPALVACGCFELLLRYRMQPPAVRPAGAAGQQAFALSLSEHSDKTIGLGDQHPEYRRLSDGKPADPAADLARQHYAADIAAGNTPSIRAIKRDLHVGSARASVIRSALTGEPSRQARAA